MMTKEEIEKRHKELDKMELKHVHYTIRERIDEAMKDLEESGFVAIEFWESGLGQKEMKFIQIKKGIGDYIRNGPFKDVKIEDEK